MSKATLYLLRDVTATEVVAELNQLYCYEQVVQHWSQAVENRLTGPVAVLLPDELTEVANGARAVAGQLATRIAQLGGEFTADPTEFVARAPIDQFALPSDYGDLAAILSAALAYERVVISRYAELAERLRHTDVVTHRLLLEILAGKLAREDEIEAVLTQHDRAEKKS